MKSGHIVWDPVGQTRILFIFLVQLLKISVLMFSCQQMNSENYWTTCLATEYLRFPTSRKHHGKFSFGKLVNLEGLPNVVSEWNSLAKGQHSWVHLEKGPKKKKRMRGVWDLSLENNTQFPSLRDWAERVGRVEGFSSSLTNLGDT